MPKTRTNIPKAIRDKVLKEYHHKCAMCGRTEPHLHHIDENPSNNDIANLLPLCPNCHLQDTHDPTAPHDPDKLRLFRRCKDPFVLDHRFHPIWRRIQAFRAQGILVQENRWTKNYTVNSLTGEINSWQDLTNFVRTFQKGEYYADRLNDARAYRDEWRLPAIEDLCVEMLRYQGWELPKKRDAE